MTQQNTDETQTDCNTQQITRLFSDTQARVMYRNTHAHSLQLKSLLIHMHTNTHTPTVCPYIRYYCVAMVSCDLIMTFFFCPFFGTTGASAIPIIIIWFFITNCYRRRIHQQHRRRNILSIQQGIRAQLQTAQRVLRHDVLHNVATQPAVMPLPRRDQHFQKLHLFGAILAETRPPQIDATVSEKWHVECGGETRQQGVGELGDRISL
jgi:hypothetical protein